MKNITGKRIRELREHLKLTGNEFGEKLDVTKTAVSNWENGNRLPNIAIINKIADYFEVSSDYLLGRTDNPNNSFVQTTQTCKCIELVVNSKSSKYTQEQIQLLIDKLSEMYIDVNKLINT